MSLAEEMLATMPLSYDSSTYSADEEPHIVINESRQAIVPNELKTIAVTGDKDIETVTFDCVRYWDGNDLSTFAIYLNYVLPDNTPGTYIPKAITTSDGEDVYHFDWKIKNNITTKSGKISFAITAVKTKQNENGETVVDKQWSSLPNGDCSIALGLGISNVPTEEESSDVVAQLSAILEKIHGDLDEWIKTVVVQTTGTSKTQVMSQEAVTTSLNIYKVESIQQSNEYTDSKSNLLDKKILQNSNKISRNSKRITNLEQGLVPSPFVTDDSVAYIKDVPLNALPFAEISKIGGMTYKNGDTLKSAPVTEVESVGVNKIDIAHATKGDNGSIIVQDNAVVWNFTSSTVDLFAFSVTVALKKNTDYTLKFSGTSVRVAYIYSDKLWGNAIILSLANGGTFNSGEYESAVIGFYSFATHRQGTSETISEVMLNEGKTALPYAPYVKRTFPIPEAVQALDGYGWGVNADRYNYVDWEKKQFVKRVEKVDLGTLNWSGGSVTSRFYAPVTNAIERGAAICSIYNIRYENVDKVGYLTNLGGDIVFVVNDADYTDAATFKAAMQGVMLYYELATPEVTDISDLISADNFIGVEGNGTLTFKNAYDYAVPSEVEYQVEV